IRSQLNTVTEKVKNDDSQKELVEMAKAIDQKMTKVEQELYQTKNRSNQDPLNFPIKLNNKLANVGSQVNYGNFKPTQQAVSFKNEITQQIDQQLEQFYQVVKEDLPEFNQMVKESSVNAVTLKENEAAMVNP
ncbi:MAG: glycosyl hydrolase, partial [Cyclobacteriaceae bacterium]